MSGPDFAPSSWIEIRSCINFSCPSPQPMCLCSKTLRKGHDLSVKLCNIASYADSKTWSIRPQPQRYYGRRQTSLHVRVLHWVKHVSFYELSHVSSMDATYRLRSDLLDAEITARWVVHSIAVEYFNFLFPFCDTGISPPQSAYVLLITSVVQNINVLMDLRLLSIWASSFFVCNKQY